MRMKRIVLMLIGIGSMLSTPAIRLAAAEPGLTRKSETQIEIAFDRNKGALYALYRRALEKNPGIQGRIVLRISITKDGRVSDCLVKSSSLASPELEARICERVKQIPFGTLPHPVVRDKPIDFYPAA